MTALLLAALLGAAPAEPSAPPEVNPLHRAATALRAKDFEGARRLYESVLETDPRSWDALFGRARALAFSGSYAEGVKAFTEMLAIHPRDPDALLARGRVYAWLGNFYAAQLDLEAVTSAYPSYVDAWSALGDIFLWSGRPKDALAIYDRWVVVRPESADAYLARARARRDMRDFSGARYELVLVRRLVADSEEADRLELQLARLVGPGAWTARATWDTQVLTESKLTWHAVDASLAYDFDRVVVGARAAATRRQETWEPGGGAWADLPVWRLAYVHVEGSGAPGAEAIARLRVGAELYQGLAGGYEGALSCTWARYASDQILMFGAAGARYIGRWYARVRAQLIPAGRSVGVVAEAIGRLHLRTIDELVEVRLGAGRDVLTVGPDLPTGVPNGAWAAARGQTFFTRALGVGATLQFVWQSGGASRAGLAVSGIGRW